MLRRHCRRALLNGAMVAGTLVESLSCISCWHPHVINPFN